MNTKKIVMLRNILWCHNNLFNLNKPILNLGKVTNFHHAKRSFTSQLEQLNYYSTPFEFKIF